MRSRPGSELSKMEIDGICILYIQFFSNKKLEEEENSLRNQENIQEIKQKRKFCGGFWRP